jgi:hypothetical protein
MNSRKLIEHTRDLLQEYESIRLGLTSTGPSRERKLEDPLIVDDAEVLEKYLQRHQVHITNEIMGKNEVSFIRETFLGCLRRNEILEVARFKIGNSEAFQQNCKCELIESGLLLVSGHLLFGDVEIGRNWFLFLQ